MNLVSIATTKLPYGAASTIEY